MENGNNICPDNIFTIIPQIKERIKELQNEGKYTKDEIIDRVSNEFEESFNSAKGTNTSMDIRKCVTKQYENVVNTGR